jgi:Ribbon-helix-helix protein, copG family
MPWHGSPVERDKVARLRYGEEALQPRTFRIEDSIWEELGNLAIQEGYPRAQLVRIAVLQYLERNPVTVGGVPNMSYEDWLDHKDKEHNGWTPVDGACSVCDRYIRLAR